MSPGALAKEVVPGHLPLLKLFLATQEFRPRIVKLVQWGAPQEEKGQRRRSDAGSLTHVSLPLVLPPEKAAILFIVRGKVINKMVFISCHLNAFVVRTDKCMQGWDLFTCRYGDENVAE